MHVAGLGLALIASVLFNVGIVLQALDARVAPRALGYRVALLRRLFRRPRWVLGWALGVVGIAPQALAYSRAPFVVVQPVLAVGLLIVLALGVHMLGESVGFRGSSIMKKSPPRPDSAPSIDVARRKPFCLPAMDARP